MAPLCGAAGLAAKLLVIIWDEAEIHVAEAQERAKFRLGFGVLEALYRIRVLCGDCQFSESYYVSQVIDRIGKSLLQFQRETVALN